MPKVKSLSKRNGYQMTKSGKGKVCQINKGSRTRFISVPASVAGDSAFPFTDGDRVRVTISGRSVVIEPLEE